MDVAGGGGVNAEAAPAPRLPVITPSIFHMLPKDAVEAVARSSSTAGPRPPGRPSLSRRSSLAAEPRNASGGMKVAYRMLGVDAQPFRRIGRLRAGQHFGERACWTGERRTASVVTITGCELHVLAQSVLMQLANTWPSVKHELRFTGARTRKAQSVRSHRRDTGAFAKAPQLTLRSVASAEVSRACGRLESSSGFSPQSADGAQRRNAAASAVAGNGALEQQQLTSAATRTALPGELEQHDDGLLDDHAALPRISEEQVDEGARARTCSELMQQGCGSASAGSGRPDAATFRAALKAMSFAAHEGDAEVEIRRQASLPSEPKATWSPPRVRKEC